MQGIAQHPRVQVRVLKEEGKLEERMGRKEEVEPREVASMGIKKDGLPPPKVPQKEMARDKDMSRTNDVHVERKGIRQQIAQVSVRCLSVKLRLEVSG